MINQIPKDTKIKVKIENKWKVATVILHDALEGWIELSTKEYKSFTLNTKMHANHLQIPEIVEEKKEKPKRERKPRKKKDGK